MLIYQVALTHSVLVSAEVRIADAVSGVNIYWQWLWYTVHSYSELMKMEQIIE